MKYLKTGGKWLLQLLLAVLMVGPGSQKFTSPVWERMFRTWGYPDNFYLVVGAVEVVAGIGLLIPHVASVSAIILAIVMAGAAATHIINADGNAIGEFVFMSLLIVVAVVRWRDRIRLAPHSPTTTAPAA